MGGGGCDGKDTAGVLEMKAIRGQGPRVARGDPGEGLGGVSSSTVRPPPPRHSKRHRPQQHCRGIGGSRGSAQTDARRGGGGNAVVWQCGGPRAGRGHGSTRRPLQATGAAALVGLGGGDGCVSRGREEGPEAQEDHHPTPPRGPSDHGGGWAFAGINSHQRLTDVRGSNLRRKLQRSIFWIHNPPRNSSDSAALNSNQCPFER